MIIIDARLRSYSASTYQAIINVFCDEKIIIRRINKRAASPRVSLVKPITKIEISKSRLVAGIGGYGTSSDVRKMCRRRGVMFLNVQQSFIPNSVVCDANGFWGHSSIISKMPSLVDQYIEDKYQKWSRKYSKYVVSKNMSRRAQSVEHSSMKNIGGKYVFLPMQFMRDESVKQFGGMGYQKFMRDIAKWCSKNNLIVAVKRHPKAYSRENTSVDKIMKNIKRRYPKHYKHVKGNIHWLCKNSEFMISMNSATIVDGFVNGTRVYERGISMFRNSGSVIYNKDVEEGLTQCLEMSDGDKQYHRQRQLAVIYYLYHRYLIIEGKKKFKSELNNEKKIRTNILHKNPDFFAD